MNFENHPNFNCEITTDQGQVYCVYANWLHNEKLDHWQGWSCKAGASRIHIDKNFDIWSGECQNDFLGNALTEFDLLEGTICKRSHCTGCTDDLVTEKKKIDHD